MYPAPPVTRIFDMKAIILELIKIFSLPLEIDFIRSKSEYYHPGKSADIFINNEQIGSLGELHPKLMKKFQIKQCDWMIANKVTEKYGFKSDKNKVFFIENNNIEEWKVMTKKLVAIKLVKKIVSFFKNYKL